MFRYKNYELIDNDSSFYSKQRKARSKNKITQYRLRTLGSLPDSIRNQLIITEIVWKVDTKLYKLADGFYGDPDLWWLIGYYNNKPTDANWAVGDKVLIPTPPRIILEFLDIL